MIAAIDAYHPEEGKITRGTDGQLVHLPEMKTIGATTQVLQYVQSFEGWRKPVRELKRQYLKRSWKATDEPVCHIQVMASCMAVYANDPFREWATHQNRKTFAVDMEAATFYTALRDFPLLHGLVVKGVCDYGNSAKTDHHRHYARRASAVYLLHFIQEYVTDETMPRDISFLADLVRSPLWMVPFQRHPFFTGQEALLMKLVEAFQTTQSATCSQPLAISGLGGIGKTQLAVEYAWKYRQMYQAILWSRADTHEALVSGYIALARSLNLPEKEDNDHTIIIQAVLHWLRKHYGWLLILDNADDLTVLQGFLPIECSGHLLLTTRSQALGKLAQPLEVATMSRDVGATLLLRRARRIAPDSFLDDALPADVAAARELSEDLGGLPLALDQVGAYLEETRCRLASYRERYNAQRSLLLKQHGGPTNDYPASVGTTWLLSFVHMEQHNPTAAEILRCCAFLHPDAIPEEIFTRGAVQRGSREQYKKHDLLELDEAMRVLLNASLIHRDPITATLSIHRLVQTVLLDMLPLRTRKQWQIRVVRAINTLFPAKPLDDLAQCERLLPHILVCLPWIEKEARPPRAVAYLLERAGDYLRIQGQYTEAEPLLVRACALCEQQLGPQHPDTARSLNGLAILYRYQGKDEQAESLFQRALSIREQQLGPQHLDTARSLNNLENVYRERRKYAQAESLFQRALSIREQQLGPQHLDTARSLHNLANLYRELRKYEQAEYLYQRALSIWELQLGSQHPDTAYALHALALLYRAQRSYSKSEQFFRRALSLREQILSPNHPDLAETVFEFAILRQEQNQLEEAQLLCERAREAWNRILGPTHPYVIDLLNHQQTLRITLPAYCSNGKGTDEQVEPSR